MQNRSHAVMAQRTESPESLDDFPTPPWATRALIEHVLTNRAVLQEMSCLEPGCNRGYMSVALEEYFGEVISSDIHSYGFGEIEDFLRSSRRPGSVDWVITNPPFKLGEEFIAKGLEVARHGIAMLTRTVFIESVGRYERIFTKTPPTKFAQFVERVPMVKGRLDKKASTATGYCWLVWEKGSHVSSQLVWVPPCRKALEKDSDYSLPTWPRPLVSKRPLSSQPSNLIHLKASPRPSKSRELQTDLFSSVRT